VIFLTPPDIMQALCCSKRSAIAEMRAAGGWQISDGEWRISDEGWQRWVRARETASTSGGKFGGRETGDAYTGDPESVRPETLRATYRPRKRALTRPELGGLLSELTPARGAVPAMIVGLGCRWAEAMRLLPSDFEADRVLIRGTKTEGSYRWVPILSLYRPLLEAALPHLPLEPWENVRRDLGRACRRAGIEPCTPNDLRRTHATLLVEAGVDRDVIRRLLGHTTAAMVDRVYGQPTTEALGALAERKLLEAAPLEPVQFRHSEAPADEDPGASLEGRTPDLRFTKPARGTAKSAPKGGVSGNRAELTPVDSVDSGPARSPAGTSTSQPASPAARSFRAIAWRWFARSA
jgi:hypothetical protein